ncbi:MAG: squalene synthase HpnD [Geminicoccaceae bacterium]|nr:MAG: squalene synthase HpnD [Geminicoccaceae bacterium]
MRSVSSLEPDVVDDRYVDRVVAAAGSSFFWAMRLLPPPRRRIVFAIYAFCREVDDIADDDRPRAQKLQDLQFWRAEIARLYAGEPTRPITRVLAGGTGRYGLDRNDFEAIIDGMAMDAEGPVVAPSRAELDLYCDRVASAVGRLCVPVFGEPGARGRAVADPLGRALQLTNILRDLDEDAALGRLYLPREALEEAGIPLDPTRAIAHPALPTVCADLAAEAAGCYDAAAAAIRACDGRRIRPARMMMAVYRCTFDRLAARGWAAPRRAVRPSKGLKLWIALRSAFGEV